MKRFLIVSILVIGNFIPHSLLSMKRPFQQEVCLEESKKRKKDVQECRNITNQTSISENNRCENNLSQNKVQYKRYAVHTRFVKDNEELERFCYSNRGIYNKTYSYPSPESFQWGLPAGKIDLVLFRKITENTLEVNKAIITEKKHFREHKKEVKKLLAQLPEEREDRTGNISYRKTR